MKLDSITVCGVPFRVAVVIDVTSPFTVGWTTQDVAAHTKAAATITMTLPAVKKMRRLLAGQHLPKRLREAWPKDWATSPAGTGHQAI